MEIKMTPKQRALISGAVNGGHVGALAFADCRARAGVFYVGILNAPLVDAINKHLAHAQKPPA